jgi:hypothetical protein
MLNRTLSTTPANLNRLSLGTRSLALAGFNTGSQTFVVRHAHPKRNDSVRAGDIKGIMRDTSYPMMMEESPAPMSPGSPPVPAWPVVAAAGWARVVVVAEAPPAERQVVTDSPCRPDRSRGQGRPWNAERRPEGQRVQPQRATLRRSDRGPGGRAFAGLTEPRTMTLAAPAARALAAAAG